MSVTVNGVEIPESAIAEEMQHHPADSVEEAKREAAHALVVRELMLQEARRLAIEHPDPLPPDTLDEGDAESEEEAILRTLVAREIRVPEPDDHACRRFYETHQQELSSPDLFEARHILIEVDPRDRAALASAKAAAERLIAELTESPERFAALAAEHSTCSSREQGGMIGQITLDDVVPEFASFLDALEEGQLCPVPVVTRYGVHVLRLEHRIEGRPLPFEEVSQRIAGYLSETVWRRAVSQYVQILAGRALITGVEIKGASSPLVQ